MRIITKLPILVVILLIATKTSAITLGESIGKYYQYLDCSDLDPRITSVCYEMKKSVDEELEGLDLKISGNDIIYSKNPAYPSRKVHGHCSTQLYLRGGHLSVRAKDTSEITVKGNSISEPVILALNLDAKINTRANIKLEYGNMFAFGSCNDYASDSGYALGQATTNVKIISAFYLDPVMLEPTPTHFRFEISPKFKIIPQISSFELSDVSIHGVNELAATMIGIVSGYSELVYLDLGSSIGNWVLGESLQKTLTDLGVEIFSEHLAVPTILLIEQFGGIEDFEGNLLGIDLSTQKEITRMVARYNSSTDGLFNETENRINQKINSALNLDSNGKRIISIPRTLIPNPHKGTTVEIEIDPPQSQYRGSRIYSIPSGIDCEVEESHGLNSPLQVCSGHFDDSITKIDLYFEARDSWNEAWWNTRDCRTPGPGDCTLVLSGLKNLVKVTILDAD